MQILGVVGQKISITPKLWLTSGYNRGGQLGLGHKKPVVKWTQFNPPLSFIEISASGDFSVAVAANGSAFSWGNNQYGQLGIDGLGSFFQQKRPKKINLGNNTDPVITVHAGWRHAAAVTGLSCCFLTPRFW